MRCGGVFFFNVLIDSNQFSDIFYVITLRGFFLCSFVVSEISVRTFSLAVLKVFGVLDIRNVHIRRYGRASTRVRNTRYR